MAFTGYPGQQEYGKALRFMGWERMDELPGLHDAIASCSQTVRHVQKVRAAQTFGDVRDALIACEMGTIVEQCWVLADYGLPVSAGDPERFQPPHPTGWWIVDLGPFAERAEPTMYKAVLAGTQLGAGSAVSSADAWSVLQCDGIPGAMHQKILDVMTINRAIFPWGYERLFVKRFPKDTGGHWVYRAPASIYAIVHYTGIVTQATPSVEIKVVQNGPPPEREGESLGLQHEWRTANLKIDFQKALGEGRTAITEAADKAIELAALVRIALAQPQRAGELVTALTDDRYDPPSPGKTSMSETVMAICDASPVLDLLEQIADY